MENRINNLRINEAKYNQTGRAKNASNLQSSFNSMLEKKINANEQDIKFSKHAQLRLAEREISLTDDDIAKLKEAISLAEAKGINNSLIVTDTGVYIANISSRTIITAMDSMKEKVFTNVDGVINI